METVLKQDLVELLFLALYQDGHVSVDEDSMLQRALEDLGWKSDDKTGPSVERAFAAVREANSCEATREEYLTQRLDRLKVAGHSLLAFEWLGKVLASDGLDSGEAHFLERVRRLLFD